MSTLRSSDSLLLANGHSTDDARRYRAAGLWGDRTLGAELHEQATLAPDKLAVASVDEALTYRELDELSDRFAAALIGLGHCPGEPAVFQLGNEVQTVVAFFGVLKAGLTPVCSIPNHGVYEVRHIAQATGATLHLFQADYRRYDLHALSEEIAASTDVSRRIVSRGVGDHGALGMDELIDGEEPMASRRLVESIDASLDPDRAMVFQLSGGTTGVPKVIGHTHSSYAGMARRWASNLGWGSDTVACTFMPIMHNAGLATALLPALLSGGSAVLCHSPDPADLVEVIARHRVSWFHFSMAAFAPLVEYAARHDCDFSSITHFTWTVTRPEMSAQAEELLSAPAVGSFGMGEGILLSARRDDDGLLRRTTVGSTLDEADHVRVLRPGTEEEAPEGELGELVFSGPSVIRCYVGAPTKVQAAAFTSDGALRSGDLGRVIRFGDRRCFTMEGRLKDQIVRGGEKFMAEELEQLLVDHGAVREAAVVGVPDRRLGDRVGAFIVCEPDTTPPDKDELVEFLRAKGVAKFKWPELVVHVEALPRTGIGKVQKDELRSRLPVAMDYTPGGSDGST